MKAADMRKIGALIDKHVEPDAPGLVLAAAKDGRIVYQRAIGLANVEHGVANTLATRLPIASVTKQFTAALALRMAELGLVTIEASIRSYLPELPVLEGEPTVRQLLDHRGGYRDYLDTAFADGFALKPAGEPLTFHERQESVNFAPGAAQVYSNSGYHLVSLALERQGDAPFEDLLAKYIFEPLGMANSVSVRNDWPVLRGLADTYLPLGADKFRKGINVSQQRLGEGAVYSTVGDMLLWLAALRTEGEPLSKESWRALKRVPDLLADPPSKYALGLQMGELGGRKIIEHGGGVMGAVSHAASVPADGIDVVVLANTLLPSKAIAHDIIRLLQSGDSEVDNNVVAAANHRNILGAFYSEQRGWLFRFDEVDGALALSQSGGAALPVGSAQATKDWFPFKVDTPTGTMRFSSSENANRAGFVLYDAGQMVQFEPAPASPNGSFLDQVSGTYRNAATETTLSFSRNAEGRLMMRAQGGFSREDFIVTPHDNDIATIRHTLMPYFATLSAVREGGRIARIDFSTGRTWRLPFLPGDCK